MVNEDIPPSWLVDKIFVLIDPAKSKKSSIDKLSKYPDVQWVSELNRPDIYGNLYSDITCHLSDNIRNSLIQFRDYLKTQGINVPKEPPDYQNNYKECPVCHGWGEGPDGVVCASCHGAGWYLL